jgi:uncharacterized protein
LKPALWTGSPQWQFGFAPLGPADSAIKNRIFVENTARLYHHERTAAVVMRDKLSDIKSAYQQAGATPSNLRYGYIRRQV